MNTNTLSKIKLDINTSLREVMKVFSDTAQEAEGRGFALIVNDQSVCLGVVTDGDVRRAILESHSLDTPVGKVMNTQFTFSRKGDSSHKILRLFDQRVKAVPVLDVDNKVCDVMFYSDFRASAGHDKKIMRARVPVRVSFAGGGTDVSYYMQHSTGVVLSSTINKYCYATILVRPDNRVRIISRDYQTEVEAACVKDLRYDGKLDLLKACVKMVNPEFGFDLETYSEIEPGTGLGGSSAMSAAVIGALNQFRHEDHLDNYMIADLAYQAERVELNISGGWQDQYSTVFGGFSFIEFRPNEVMVFPMRLPEEILLELHYNLLLFRFGKSRVSGSIAGDQQKNFLASRSDMRTNYDLLAQLAVDMKECLIRGSLRRFGELLNEGWYLKKKLSSKISNGQIESLYDAARQAGALGGKVLGAGGEGYLLLYCSPAYQVQVIEKLDSLGVKAQNFDFVKTGLQTWTTPSLPARSEMYIKNAANA